jgi:hypothetical protein
MSRWLLLSCCVLVLAAVSNIEARRLPNARALGGQCLSDSECQTGLRCTHVTDVMDGQCAAPCNSTPWCQERFGSESLCLGADVCARTCKADADCAAGAHCNGYHWCEGQR